MNTPNTNALTECRYGRFSVTDHTLKTATHDELRALFADVVVVRAELVVVRATADYMSQRVEYAAAHPTFAPVPPGMIAPMYEAAFHVEQDAPIQVTWKKVEG